LRVTSRGLGDVYKRQPKYLVGQFQMAKPKPLLMISYYR
jgi:hypothetical protein